MARLAALSLTLLLLVACFHMGDKIQALSAADGTVTTGDVVFHHEPDLRARTVYLTGDFTGWDPHAIEMTDYNGDNIWSATCALAPGEYQYQFVVIPWPHMPALNTPQRDPIVTPTQALTVTGIRGW
jgi:Glycogen recognition site of AMP-activated protein kinase